MRDRWINMGYEDKDLKPYREPLKDLIDPKRIGNDSEPVATSLYHAVALLLHM